jgi:hypothetical protein
MDISADNRVSVETGPDGKTVIVIKPHDLTIPDRPTFDIEQTTGNIRTGKQSFSRIKRIYAKDGLVHVEVDHKVIPGVHGGRPLLNQKWSVREAAERATELNKMASVVDAADYKMLMEIVENTIRACKEAQQQLLKPPEKKIIVPGAGQPGSLR